MRITGDRTTVALLLAGAVATFLACVGEDPATTSPVPSDPNAKVGEYRGRCNNGQCFPGLECSKDDVCLYINYPDGGIPPGATDGGGSTTDGGSSGTDGAAAVACPLSVIHTNENPCPGTTADECSQNNLTCCLGSGGNVCKSSVNDCDPDPAIRCSGLGQCSGDVCCLKLVSGAIATDVCPGTVARANLNKTDCVTQTNCAADDYKVCRNNGECVSANCRRIVVQSAAGNIELGVCL